MSNNKSKLITNQASVADSINTENTAIASTSGLPANYLSSGYYATTEKGTKYLRPEFVGEYAEITASLLADMNLSDFNNLLREMKRSKKKTLPFEARQTAAAEMLPKALALVHRKKAPAFLVTFIRNNLDHIQNDDDWHAFFRCMVAISGFLASCDIAINEKEGGV